MFHKPSKQIMFGIFVALFLMTMPVYAVKNFKISDYGGGHQIWFEVEDFDERDPDDDSSFALGNEDGAFGQSISSVGSTDGASMIRYTFNIGSAGGASGTWYFWGRVINPDNSSDFMLVEGHPGDTMPVTLPMCGLIDDQRMFEENAGPPWTWSGNDHDEAHTKTLQDGENTMYILARQDGAIWDVFMWTDDAGYVPTDNDYQNAFPGGGYGPALRPEPADGAIYTQIWASPRWKAGDFAVTHDVYFSDNFDDVNDGTGDAFVGNQPLGTEYFLVGFANAPYPDGLVPGTTYYWRIDEVNEAEPNSPWKGDVWSFTVPSYKAYDPVPGDGAKYVVEDVELSWTAGLGAILHNVYFGEDLETVTNATGAPPQPDTTFSPGPLELEKTYYWRVDEFDEDAATHTGDVWSFSTVPYIPITDPNLLCWWKFDEEAGSTALDHSGHGQHGTLEGDAQWVDGIVGVALEFDGAGDRVVDDTAAAYLNGLDAITVCMWIKSDVVGTDKGFIDGEDPDGSDNVVTMRYDSSGANGGGSDVLKMAVTSTEGEQQLESSNDAQTTDWQHVAMVWSSGQQLRFYINGVLDVPTDNQPATTGTTTGCTKLIIGAGGKDAGGGWDGLIDDVRIYNKVLTAEEITEVMRGEPDLAWNSSPANRSTPDIKQATPLSWLPGDRAAQHDVYFGTDKDAVDNADTSTADIYRGRQAGTSYSPPEGVEWGGGPYYWRVDEFNTDGTISKGRIWSFTVADFILIDDFESYNIGDNEIWFAWHDGLGAGAPGSPDFVPSNGTGSEIGDGTTGSYTEESIVHGGNQSMPYWYNNNKQGFNKYSEAELTLSDTRDWTAGGVEELSLWFRGNPVSVGSFTEGPVGTYTMTASGADIFGTADEFHYAYKMLTGAGSIIARVESVELTDSWAKAGVMIRETLDAGSKFAGVYIMPTNPDGSATEGCRFQARLDTDLGATSDTSVSTTEQRAIIAPYWVKLERDVAGNFSGYYSADGSSWRSMFWNPQNISMNSNVYIGLALTSHNNSAVCEAVFSNVTISGSVVTQWANQDIGIESNVAEPLYVAVSNSAGSPAVVYHNDPGAANVDIWTEWPIPLQDLVDLGLNLTDVDRIVIGVGTRGNTTIPGGSGKMYFDDIRLYRSRTAP